MYRVPSGASCLVHSVGRSAPRVRGSGGKFIVASSYQTQDAVALVKLTACARGEIINHTRMRTNGKYSDQSKRNQVFIRFGANAYGWHLCVFRL